MKRNLFFSALLLCSSSVYSQVGELDPTFGTNAGFEYYQLIEESEFFKLLLVDEADRIYLGGNVMIDGDSQSLLVRCLPDGTVDSSFNGDGLLPVNLVQDNFDGISAMAFHDGGLLLCGSAFVDSQFKPYVIKYSSEGILDLNFGDLGLVMPDISGSARGLFVDSESNILVALSTSDDNVGVFKILPDGELDNSFSSDGIVVSVNANLATVSSIDVDSEGNVFLFGDVELNGIRMGRINAFTPNGASLVSFSLGAQEYPWPNNNEFYVKQGFITENNKMLLLGIATSGSTSRAGVLRVGMDGVIDQTFGDMGYVEFASNPGVEGAIFNHSLESDGLLYLAYSEAEGNIHFNGGVVCLDENGNFNTSFNQNGNLSINATVNGIDETLFLATQSDGKLLALGQLEAGDGGTSSYVARIFTEISQGVASVNAESLYSIYPNPAADFITVKFQGNLQVSSVLRIFDLSGRTISETRMLDFSEEIDIRHLQQGIYFVDLDGRQIGRFIKN